MNGRCIAKVVGDGTPALNLTDPGIKGLSGGSGIDTQSNLNVLETSACLGLHIQQARRVQRPGHIDVERSEVEPLLLGHKVPDDVEAARKSSQKEFNGVCTEIVASEGGRLINCEGEVSRSDRGSGGGVGGPVSGERK